jgi:hypothetical protein
VSWHYGGYVKVDTIARELLFTTVRLTNIAVTGVPTSVGTGFIVNASRDPQVQMLVVVTNKHVIAGASAVRVDLIARDPAEDQPLLGQSAAVTFGEVPKHVQGHPHPDVDVAVFSFNALLPHCPRPPFYRGLPHNIFPEAEDLESFDAIEEVTFIGYPNGHNDAAHGTPIVRQGITATPLELPFEGLPQFLVDGSVFGGSSGSPVFIYNNGMYRTGPGMVTAGTRVRLIGVLAATTHRETLLPVLTAVQGPHVRIAQELNLGIAFNWSAVEETIDAWCSARGLDRDRPVGPVESATTIDLESSEQGA